MRNRVFHFGDGLVQRGLWDGLVQRGLSWFKNEEKGEAAAVEFKTLFRILKKHLADGNDIPCFFRELMAMEGRCRVWNHEIIFAAHS